MYKLINNFENKEAGEKNVERRKSELEFHTQKKKKH